MHYFYLVLVAIQVLGPLVRMVLKMIGIGVVSYVGINFALGEIQNYVHAQLGNAPGPLQAILGIANFDVAISIYLSAVTTRFVLAGMDKISGRKKSLGNTGVLEA